jgi:3-hydroxymyristoyl/3-hydroxydecanoyl-(acyl carrier protein) dehydratase
MGDARALADIVIDAATARARVRRERAVELCRGHFPGEPIVPGAMLVGIMAELASVLVGEPDGAPTTIVRARFVRRVEPDDAITVTATRTGARVDVELLTAGVRAARATFDFGGAA